MGAHRSDFLAHHYSVSVSFPLTHAPAAVTALAACTKTEFPKEEVLHYLTVRLLMLLLVQLHFHESFSELLSWMLAGSTDY